VPYRVYLSASAVVIHYEEALYQVYVPFTFTFASLIVNVRLGGRVVRMLDLRSTSRRFKIRILATTCMLSGATLGK